MAKSGPQRFPAASTKTFYQEQFGGKAMEVNVVVWHSTETLGVPSYGGGKIAPNFTAAPDFKRERIVWHQHFDFDVSSRALKNLSGGVETNTLNACQVEVVGTCDPKKRAGWVAKGRPHLFMDDLPAWAIRDLAAFARWASEKHGVPLTSSLTWKKFDASYGRKNGTRMSGDEWRAYTGHCGHQHVPENVHGDPGGFAISKILKLAAAASEKKKPNTATYVVKPKDTLFGIASSHGLTVERLRQANPALPADATKLAVGTVVTIPLD